jgi:mRNA-degrading endonuclease YafQ of YafQ-DinJ toxin-antitoxin module
MKIIFHKHFQKAYQKLPKKIQAQVDERIRFFLMSPYHPDLNNHKLHGAYEYHRSIDISGDYRAVFILLKHDLAFFKIVGTHHQLYGV